MKRTGGILAGCALTMLSAFLLWAEEAKREAVQESPFLEEGKAFEAKGKWKKAERAYVKAVEASPSNGKAYQAFASFYAERERPDDGIAYFFAMLENHPERAAGCHFALGILYRAKKDYGTAREHYLKAMEAFDPEFVKGLLEKEQKKEPSHQDAPALPDKP